MLYGASRVIARRSNYPDVTIYLFIYLFISTLQYNTVCICPQTAKANRGGRSYMQSVVKPVIIKLQQYSNIRLKE